MSEEARMKARRAQQVEILKLQEERLDEHMANLYSEQQVGQLRSYSSIVSRKFLGIFMVLCVLLEYYAKA
jgi:hypothetical protein